MKPDNGLQSSEAVIKTEKLGKSYLLPDNQWLRVFEGLDFELKKGELVAIAGVSGVGKTTFLNIVGGLDRPTEGRVFFNGQDLWQKSPLEIAFLRNRYIGFVFQFYHLLPEFNALENVAIPLLIGGLRKEEAFYRAGRVLAEVGMSHRASSRPAQLSGGEQQRVAVARALVTEPAILLADEPTGNLDWKTGERILQLIIELHQRKGLSSIIVTHNEKIARLCHKAYLLEAGRMKLFEGLSG